MREYDFDPMNGAELSQLLSELPPTDNIVHDVTPWRRAMERIVIGLALTTITLHFLWLDYLLPFIGELMLVLGFRTLRQENRWFRLNYIISLGRLAVGIASLVAASTIWQSRIFAALDTTEIRAGIVLVTFLNLFALRQGLCAVHRRAGLTPDCSSVNLLIVWTVLLCVLASIQYSGLLLGLAVLAVYILIIWSLLAVAELLDEAGYAISPAPVRLSDSGIKKLVSAVVLAGMAAGYLFFHSYPMEWTPAPGPDAADTQVQEAADRLLDMGFPDEVLKDLRAEDVLACRNAVRLVWDTQDYPVDSGRQLTVLTEPKTNTLRLTGIAAELPGGNWRIFHHFRWLDDPGAQGTENLQMWPAYRENEYWTLAGEWSGQLRCERDGTTWVSDYWALETVNYTGTGFWGSYQSRDVFADFSFPGRAENQRGYVSYEIRELCSGAIIDSWFGYTHQNSFIQFPVRTARDMRMTGSMSQSGSFFRVQDALQFYPLDTPLETLRQQTENAGTP